MPAACNCRTDHSQFQFHPLDRPVPSNCRSPDFRAFLTDLPPRRSRTCVSLKGAQFANCRTWMFWETRLPISTAIVCRLGNQVTNVNVSDNVIDTTGSAGIIAQQKVGMLMCRGTKFTKAAPDLGSRNRVAGDRGIFQVTQIRENVIEDLPNGSWYSECALPLLQDHRRVRRHIAIDSPSFSSRLLLGTG